MRHHEVTLPEAGEWKNDTGEPASFHVLGVVVPVGGKLVRDEGGGFTVYGSDDEEKEARARRERPRPERPKRTHHYEGASWKADDRDTRHSRRRR